MIGCFRQAWWHDCSTPPRHTRGTYSLAATWPGPGAADFVARNGYTWTHGSEGQAEAARAVDALAAGTVSEERFTNWVGHQMRGC
jgi:hypothetical protein